MGCELVVDCIFGTGVQLMSNFMYEVVGIVNDYAEHIVAIDIASGVEGDTDLFRGRRLTRIQLLRLVFQMGLIFRGCKHSGEIYTIDVGSQKPK